MQTYVCMNAQRPPTATTGFPSPAGDLTEGRLDLQQLLVRHPAATFFLRAEAGAPLAHGVRGGDLLVVDRAVEPRSGDLVVAAVEGELRLVSHDPDRPSGRIWGTVTFAIHALRDR